MNYYHEMKADSIRRAHEEIESLSHQHEGEDRATVRKIAIAVLETLEHRNDLDDIRLDGKVWQIGYGGSLPFKDRPILEQIIAEQLGLPATRVKLVGIGY